jgi:hypothetical protein
MKLSISDLGHGISAFAGSMLHARTKQAAMIRTGAVFALTGGLFLVSTANLAEAASNLRDYNQQVVQKTNNIADVITYVAYIGGAAFAALGIVDLKKHVENPTQTPMKNGLAKLGFGGMLLALPMIAGVAQGTVDSGQQVRANQFAQPPTVN